MSPMKYQVGDRVRIISRELAEVRKKTIGCPMVSSMLRYAGLEAEITKVYSACYNLNIDDEMFFWDDDCFEEDLIDSPGPIAEEEFLFILL